MMLEGELLDWRQVDIGVPWRLVLSPILLLFSLATLVQEPDGCLGNKKITVLGGMDRVPEDQTVCVCLYSIMHLRTNNKDFSFMRGPSRDGRGGQ